MLNIRQFDYNLPDELIASYPLEKRDSSRMLVLDRKTGKIQVGLFSDISSYLRNDDCIVFNNTKVIKARLFGIKSGGTARVETMLIFRGTSNDLWKCYLRPGKRLHPDSKVALVSKDGETTEYSYSIVSKDNDGSFVIRFDSSDMESIMEKCGHIPLPPYIRRKDELLDESRYQTVYSRVEGAVAAPTAGLHFTHDIINSIMEKGVKQAEITLHVGAGTFKPVSVENIHDHKMHEEEFIVSENASTLINSSRKRNGRILAVGTTSARVLETIGDDGGFVHPCSGYTDIFIYPPYKPKVVDMLLTNFHLPKSTLLMLVSAFAGIDNIMRAYQIAIQEKMRFYSYGDCMLII